MAHSNLQYLSLNLISCLTVVCGQKASAFIDFDSRTRVVCPDLIIFLYNLRFLIWLVTLLFLVIIVLANHNFIELNVSILSHDVYGIDNHGVLSGRG